MNPENSIGLPGFAISSLATVAGIDFVDAAFGVGTVLGGIADPVTAIGAPSKKTATKNPIPTVDDNPAPGVYEV